MIYSTPANQTATAETAVVAPVTLSGVTWLTYQALLRDLGEQRAARLAYDRGTLEIKMPFKLHELISRFRSRLVLTVTEELGLTVLTFGSTRFDNESLAQGVEPDGCFYIANAAQIDPTADRLPQDIPLDLVIEVDITSSSRSASPSRRESRLPIYQTMGYRRFGVIMFRAW